MWGGIGAICFGAVLLFVWWQEMFSDSYLAEMARSQEDIFDLWKNFMSVSYPAFAMIAIILGIGVIVQEATGTYHISPIFGYPILFLFVAAILGIIPVKLPDPMYWQWQLEKRRREKGPGKYDGAGDIFRTEESRQALRSLNEQYKNTPTHEHKDTSVQDQESDDDE